MGKPSDEFSGGDKSTGSIQRTLEITSIALMPILIGLVLYEIGGRFWHPDLWWALALAIFLAMLSGDMLSGIVHWACDTYGSEETPVFGPTIIKHFRVHHDFPKDITLHDFVYTNGNTCMLGVVMLAPIAYFSTQSSNLFINWIGLYFALTTVFGCSANIIHKWAHNDPEKNSGLVRLLQKYHLVLNPDHHEVHHEAPHANHYNITFGWLNPLLDRINFWRGVEKALAVVGLKPSQ